jgi:nucleoside-diphosphate-sugar epimerase
MGLDGSILRRLQSQVTGIIHCAADLKFTSSLAAARETNTEGTRRILDLAERCPQLEKLAHISTLYVAGRRPGVVLEEPLHHDFGYFNVYEQSKHEAEKLVLNRMGHLPICIYRLSSIIGHSVTGKVSQDNYFHALIRLVPQSAQIPVIPGDPETPVDLIADDWCTAALTLLYQQNFIPGRIHHLCAGLEHSLKAGEILDLAFRLFHATGGAQVPKPRMTDLVTFQRHGVNGQGSASAAMVQLLSNFLPHLALQQPFDRGKTGMILHANRLTPPDPRPFMERVLKQILKSSE